jgi:hypothetical protein
VLYPLSYKGIFALGRIRTFDLSVESGCMLLLLEHRLNFILKVVHNFVKPRPEPFFESSTNIDSH